ncbi:MAG: heavy metal translocating P-type ATPase [Phycisphaera sp.]|nr:heavy metal translocating P-type ATPase [Phycisphaera sp.]
MTTLSRDIPTDLRDRATDADARTRAGDAACNVAVRCTHCGLPVPRGLVDTRPDAATQFCCDGCRTVWSMIHDHGLDPYYRMRDDAAADTSIAPAATTGRAYDEFDDAAFARVYVRSRPDGAATTELLLEGVHCAACVWLVEKLPRIVPGVIESRLSLRTGVVQITWDAAATTLSTIARALDRLGYPPHAARGVEQRRVRLAEDRAALVRIAVAGACAGNAMLIAVALYAGEYSGMDATTHTVLRWVSMGIGLLALAWPGAGFFRGALAALRTRTAHLDLPIALGLTAGGAAGVVNTVLGRGDIYFDSLAVLVLLLLVGRFIQRRQQTRATDTVELLFSLWPSACRRVETRADGIEAVRDVSVESIEAGDVVEVRAGESVPVDGVIEQGGGAVDAALLTGESTPVEVRAGDRVFAGTVNTGTTLRVRVEHTGADTRAGRLMALVERATSERAPIVQWADRIAGWFVVVAIALASASFAAWLVLDPLHAADHAVALLIVACPCALGLATPLVLAVALGRAAQRQMLIKGGDTLQRLSRPGTILLDKTGTLTTGRLTVERWIGDESARELAAAVEAHSTHPIARALTQCEDGSAETPLPRVGERLGESDGSSDAPSPERAHAVPDGSTLTPALSLAGRESHALTATDVRQSPDGGIGGTVDGRRVEIGGAPYLRARGVELSVWAIDTVEACVDDGLTGVMVAVDGMVVAVAGVGDTLRPDAAEAVDALRRRGWRIGVLSGDHPRVVQRVAARLGINAADAHGRVTPEDKARVVRERLAANDGPVVMVGDGVNDAAALGAATVGVAVHGGAEASLAAAQVYVARPGLMPIVDLLDGAHRTVRNVRRNLAVSLGYNVLTVSLAACGLISPLLAAVLMPVSSFTVLTLSIAGRTFANAPVRTDGGAS